MDKTLKQLLTQDANFKLRTSGGEPPTFFHSHDGYPTFEEDILKAVKAGKKAYTPTDPVSIDQRPYREYLEKRGKDNDS